MYFAYFVCASYLSASFFNVIVTRYWPRNNLIYFMETYMNASVVSAVTTALWILIEAIQFAYMAYLMWRTKNDTNRHVQRARSAFASA